MMGLSSYICRFLFGLLVFAVPLSSQGAVVLVLGDSISAGYGLENPALGWVGLMSEKIKETRKPWDVINASIPGEVTAGGLNRIDSLLTRYKPGILILELGANDGLRGLQPSLMQANLSEIMALAKKSGAKVLLLGMRIPPNYGKRYNELFEAVFPNLAKDCGVPYVPFLLQGIGGNAKYMQADGLHPNADAQPMLMELVWEKLQSLL